MHSHPHLHPHDLIWLYFRLFRPNQLVSLISSPPWLSQAKPKWFYGCQSWQGNSGSAQWPLLFTSYSKVNTPARTQQDCWRNSFLLRWKCVCVSVCAGSACARAEACVANSKAPFDRTVCVCQLFPLKVWSCCKNAGGSHAQARTCRRCGRYLCASSSFLTHTQRRSSFLTRGGSYGTGDGARSKVPVVQKQSCLCASERVTCPWPFLPHTGLFSFLFFLYSPSKALFAAMWFIPWNGMSFPGIVTQLGWGTLRKLEIVSRRFYGFRSVNIMITVRMNGCKLDPVFLPRPQPDIQAP